MASIKDYKLPVTDVGKQLRNFDGVKKNQWIALSELQAGQMPNTTNTSGGKNG